MTIGKKLTVILIVLLTVIAGVLLMLKIFQKNKWKNQELLSYCCSSGGGMNGGSDSCVLSAVDSSKALLTYSGAEWYSQDPEVAEYYVNAAALAEIKEIFLAEGMYQWDGKKFSNIFVADGETTGFHFTFTEDRVDFSSQVYPARYSNKLKKLDAVIQKYQVDAEKLPGLVLPEVPEDGGYSAQRVEDGQTALQVYCYAGNSLSYRVCNGTDAELAMEGNHTLSLKNGQVIDSTEGRKVYGFTVYPHSSNEESFKLAERLAPGTYVLEADGLSCEFEIR